MEKRIEFRPAFDKRDPDPKKNYGIHGVEMKFVFLGEKGATQFAIYTGWHLPHVQEELRMKNSISEPMGSDVGYHSPVPQYEGQTPISQECEYISGDCYYDGSSLWADELFKKFVAQGDDVVWQELEEIYVNHFGAIDD